MKSIRLAAFAVASLFALAACGGSSSNAVPLPGAAPAAPSPAIAAPDHKRKKKHKLVPIRITITMPHVKKHERKKNPHFIGADATQVTITLNTVNTNPPPAGLLTSVTTDLVVGTNCTVSGGTQACIVSGPSVPVGDDNITFDASDGATTLSTVTKTFTVVAGLSNSFSASLQGVPASFSLSTAAMTAGTVVAGQAFTLTAYDPDGEQITSPGDYAQPITLTTQETDGFGAILLAVNGGAAAGSVIVTNPDDVVTVSYSGLSITPFKFMADASGASTGRDLIDLTNFNPVAVCSDGGADVCASGPQVNLYSASPSIGSTANVTVTQTGWTTTLFLQDISESDNCGASGANIATVALSSSTSPGGAGTVFSVTTLGTPSAGTSCSITFSGGDGLNHSISVPVTYTVTGIGVNGRHHRP
jgi:hypothetical protein